MAYINKIQTPANNTYDIHASGIPYAQVDDTSTATDFTATVPGITSLEDGTCVLLKNGQVTSASGFTININGLGDKPCYNNLTTGYGTTAPTRDTTIFNINYTMLFIYSSDIVDGGGWICYRGYDANTNTIGYQLRTNSGNLEASDTGYKYRLWFTSADGKKWVPANTSTATNATTTRTMNTRPINPFGPIVYNSTNGTTNAGARPAVTTLWQQYTLTIGYSYVVSLTAWDPVYVQCTPQTNGSAVMNAIVKALPTSDDGKIYIYLGIAYSTTAMELRTEHPVFYHDGNGIKLWTGTKIPSKTSDLTNDSGFITSADVPEGSVASTTTPKMDGTAAVGTETAFARGDHVHPTDTSRASTATFSTSANGLVPKPNSAATNSYLNSSGTWTTPPNTTYALATTAANGLLSNQMYSLLENNAIGADESSIDGINAVNGYQIHLSLANLQGDDYILEDYATIPSATTATYGVVKPNGTASYYLNGTGGWTKPPNTQYGLATTGASGLMSATDKQKLNACSTVDNNSTYSLIQDTFDKCKLIWTDNGGTPSTFTIPDTTYYTYNEQDHYNLVDSNGNTVGTWDKEFTDLWAYKNTNNEYLLANPDYAVSMLQNMYIMGKKISGGTLKICNNFDLGFFNQIAYFTSGGMTSQTTGYIDAVSMTDDQTMHLYRINLDVSDMPSIGSTVTRTDIPNTTYSTFSTSSDGLVPHPSAASTASLLNSSGTWTALPSSVSEFTNDAGYITGMTILSYGQSTFQDFLNAYKANKVVYARASTNANPASGSQNRLAFMACVNNATTPSCVEFQYYRSVSSHTSTQQGDQVFVYTLKNTGWTVTTREASVKVVAGSNMVSTYSNNTITLNVNTFSTSANGLVPKPSSASTNSYLNSCGTWTSPSSLPSVSASDNGKVLTVVNGAWAAASLPVYQGGIRQ